MENLILDLPNGSKLKAFINQDTSWRSIDINIVYPDGKEEVLCAADYDEEDGLRVIGMDSEHDDYQYCVSYTTQKRSIWISDETADDGTWDVDVGDESGRDENLCISRLPSAVSAIDAALKLMQSRTDIRWDIVSPSALAVTVDNVRRSKSM